MEAATSVGGTEVPRALARGTFGVQGRGMWLWVCGGLGVPFGFAGGWLPPVLHPTGGGTAHLVRCVAKSTKVAGVVDCGGFRLWCLIFRRFLGVGDGRVATARLRWPFMRIWAGHLITEVVSCIDDLLTGPPPGESRDFDSHDDSTMLQSEVI